ncbi:MAG TPA: response regulator, partial [Ktedonobacterales bacterium]|nr:response regulator [Ktedonobacterales bacterium]
ESLRLFGEYEVVAAANGVEGLERCFAEQPDVIVIDVRMPQMNGLQMVRALRGDPATAQIPLIILSALVQDRDHLVGLLSGADVYLDKPVEPEQLIAVVEQTIQLSQEQRQQQMRALAEDDQSMPGEHT